MGAMFRGKKTVYEGRGGGKDQGMVLWRVSSTREASVSICLGLQGIKVWWGSVGRMNW